MPDLETLLGWRGRTVVDRDGEKLGKLGDLYLDEATDRPAWAGVRTGLFGRHESILPLDGLIERDDELVAPYPAQLVRDAPSIDPDTALDPADEERLATHYGAASDAPPPTEGAVAAGEAADAGGDGGADLSTDDARRRDDAGSVGDGAPEVIRSEEEVDVSTTGMRPTERVRLRKVLVTDHVTKTVPVRREEVRLETDPPPAGDVERVEDAGEG
jgi:hypothetical protein